jgi:hypothetical protein
MAPRIEIDVRSLQRAAPLGTLSGARLGFLDSYASRDADGSMQMYPLMSELKTSIEARFDLAACVWRVRPNIARPAGADLLDELAAHIDAPIVGECASGSSVYATVHDAVELEQRGVPTITICHDQLEAAARRHAAELGIQNLPLLIEPAAIGGVVRPADATFAEAVVASVVDALTRRTEGGAS